MPKVWLTTGASRGLGRAIAEAVPAAGDQLIATARNPEDLAGLVDKYGGQVRAVELDVRNPGQARTAVGLAVEAFGRLDVVVNNAGYGRIASIEETTDEEFRDQLETNLWGVINVTRAVLPVFRRQRSGHFLQIASILGRTALGSGGLGPYITAKHAVEGFSEALANEVMHFGVKVTIIEPGGFRTDWTTRSLTVTEPGEDYRAGVGTLLEMIRSHGGQEPGDPAKAARALLDVVQLEEPPLRLLLGNDAVDIARMADQVKTVEIDKWEHVSRSTDLDPV